VIGPWLRQPIAADEVVAAALERCSAPWRFPMKDDVLLPPPAMLSPGPLALDPLLEAYRRAPTELGPLLALGREQLQLLEREEALRLTSRKGAAGLDSARRWLGERPAVMRTSAPYFSTEACWARVVARVSIQDAGDWPGFLPLDAIRYEPELLTAAAERLAARGEHHAAMAAFLRVPAIHEGGALFYRAIDTWLRLKDPTRGLPLARVGADFFLRRGEPFKRHEMLLKAALLAEQKASDYLDAAATDEALTHYEHLLGEAKPPLLREALHRWARLVWTKREQGQNRLDVARLRLAESSAVDLVDLAAEILAAPGGGADPVQRTAASALVAALSERPDNALRFPSAALNSPAVFGALLRTQAGTGAAGAEANRVAAYASGFSDVQATGALLAQLHRNDQADELAAIAAFLSRRYGAEFMMEGRINVVISCRNVGDTFLYMAGLAAFARCSGKEIIVHHRVARLPIAEFFQHIPHIEFRSMSNELEIPAPLGLNRLAEGHVAAFYQIPWYYAASAQKSPLRPAQSGYLWDKLHGVLMSGADMVSQPIDEVDFKPTTPEAWWNAGSLRFDALGLPAGQSILIAPLANTLFSLTSAKMTEFQHFWRAVIARFRAAGFGVALNLINNGRSEPTLADTGAEICDLDLREVPGFLHRAGYFAGVRSGLCDLIALCGLPKVKSRTIYSRGAEHCIGLAPFGMSEVVVDLDRHSPEQLAASVFTDWLAAR
jgi:hypothetical protein